MRKQTKVVAVASAAALLAIGGAMTSFAAQGWVEEDGTWYYYDKDGNRVEDQWKKSGDNWFWLDGEDGGAMATDKLIDDDGDTYYVDGNGVMVTNTWVKVVNEDQDDDEDDPPKPVIAPERVRVAHVYFLLSELSACGSCAAPLTLHSMEEAPLWLLTVAKLTFRRQSVFWLRRTRVVRKFPCGNFLPLKV